MKKEIGFVKSNEISYTKKTNIVYPIQELLLLCHPNKNIVIGAVTS